MIRCPLRRFIDLALEFPVVLSLFLFQVVVWGVVMLALGAISGWVVGDGDIGAFSEHDSIGADLGRTSRLASGFGRDFGGDRLATEFAESSEGDEYRTARDRNQEPVGVDWRSWARVAFGTLLFYAGCLFAYLAEFRRYRLKAGLIAYSLITSGLICGFWDRLWS